MEYLNLCYFRNLAKDSSKIIAEFMKNYTQFEHGIYDQNLSIPIIGHLQELYIVLSSLKKVKSKSANKPK